MAGTASQPLAVRNPEINGTRYGIRQWIGFRFQQMLSQLFQNRSLEPSRKDVSWPSLGREGKKEKSMEMQGDMEKQNRRKEQEYIKGLKRYEQKGIPVYIDGKKPEEEDWEKIFQIQEDGGFYMSDFIGLEDGKLREIHFDKVYNH